MPSVTLTVFYVQYFDSSDIREQGVAGYGSILLLALHRLLPGLYARSIWQIVQFLLAPATLEIAVSTFSHPMHFNPFWLQPCCCSRYSENICYNYLCISYSLSCTLVYWSVLIYCFIRENRQWIDSNKLNSLNITRRLKELKNHHAQKMIRGLASRMPLLFFFHV